MDDAGAFLNLAPNGVNVLKELGVTHRLDSGFPSQSIHFFNSKGERIGELDSRHEEQRYGAQNLMMKRGLLHKALREELLDQGIRMEFGKRLKDIEVTDEQTVIAHFEDGTTAQGDFLIGCDGLHSRTRRIMLPDGPAPAYTGVVDCGGYSQLPGPEGASLKSAGAQQMIFGKAAFFGYIGKPDGEVWWFSNVAWPQEPSREELKAIHDDDWMQRVLALHANDPAPIPEIIRGLKDSLGKWPIYDMPPLPTWHKGPICLTGDAAHATSPHAGQGASLAIEDAVVLAKCLRDIPKLDLAFATFQALRKERVEKIVEQGRRIGDRKIPGPLMGWFRDRMLPFFLKAGTAQLAPIYSYKVDWKTKVTPAVAV
jgi:2-polyprenyl-6-methoxyphenol hydroxylase-like FAD-dependent oxidoreductase